MTIIYREGGDVVKEEAASYISPVMETWTIGKKDSSTWYDSNPIGSRYMINPQSGKYSIHTGADLNLAYNKDKNHPVYSIYSGQVIFAERVKGSTWGNLVVIDHGDMCSRYGHLGRIDVKKGDAVYTGQQIGLVGNTGMEWGDTHHLHFDICKTDALNKVPTYWPGGNRAKVEEHFVDPHKLIFGSTQPQIIEYIVLRVVANVLNVRTGPSISYRITRKLSYGSSVVVKKSDWDSKTPEFLQIGPNEYCSRLWLREDSGSTLLGFNIDGRPESQDALGDQLTYNAMIRLPLAVARHGEEWYKQLAYRFGNKPTVWVLNHQFYGEGAGFNWNLMSDADWSRLTQEFCTALSSFLRRNPIFFKSNFIFQIWNEQDQASPAAVYMPPDKYGQFLNAVMTTLYEAASVVPHAAGTKLRVITGGFVSPTIAYMRAVKTALTSLTLSRLEAISVHPYGAEGEQFGFKVKLTNVKSLFESVWGNKPVWITEVGLCGGSSTSLPRKTVSDYVKRVKNEAKRLKFEALLWYAYNTGQDNCTGLVNGSDTSVLKEFLNG